MSRLRERLDPSKHLVVRLWLRMTVAVLAVTLALMLALQLLFNSYFGDRAREQAAMSASMAATAFSDQWERMLNGFVSGFGTEDFVRLLPALAEAQEGDATQLNLSLQSSLTAMVRENSLAYASLLVNRNGTAFHPLSMPVTEAGLDMSLGYPEEMFRGVTLLPVRQSPVAGGQNAAAVAFPLTTLSASGMLAVTADYTRAELVLYLLLDPDALNALLDTYASQGVSGTLYLLSSDGDVLNGIADDRTEPLRRTAQSAAAGGDSGLLEYGDTVFFWQRIEGPDILLVNAVPRGMLLQELRQVMVMIPALGVFAILLLTALMLALSRSFTKPVRKLQRTVTAIADGSYDGKEPLRLQDELGQLSHAMAEMYRTIQEQMVSLRQEQEARSRAELKVISEQINPHFLYNTLEAVNMEIYAGHAESASAMLQALGEFLRIGLSFGSSTITVTRELEHVRAYVSIMSRRFGHRLIFTAAADPDCAEEQVPKVILQPLVENAIRHGFHMDSEHGMLDDQFIQVEVHRRDGELQLSVIDNGVGIDIPRAEQMLLTDPAKQKHVGLNNVYQRLRMRYGEGARITFESIPYYRNTVCIHIPLPQTEAEPSS